jgi:hypothetical protein
VLYNDLLSEFYLYFQTCLVTVLKTECAQANNKLMEFITYFSTETVSVVRMKESRVVEASILDLNPLSDVD